MPPRRRSRVAEKDGRPAATPSRGSEAQDATDQRVSAAHALRFLLHNAEFPRSVQYSLARIQGIVPGLPPRPAVDRALTRATGLVRQADPGLLATGDPAGFMDEIQVYLGRLHEAVAESYFSG